MGRDFGLISEKEKIFKKTENNACILFVLVVLYRSRRESGKQNIRVWRSLVSRLNGVQEASSSNLDTRTKGSAFRDESASFFIPDLAFLLFFDIISLQDKSEVGGIDFYGYQICRREKFYRIATVL